MKNQFLIFESLVESTPNRNLSLSHFLHIIFDIMKSFFLNPFESRIAKVNYDPTPLEFSVENYILLSPWPTGRGPIEARLSYGSSGS